MVPWGLSVKGEPAQLRYDERSSISDGTACTAQDIVYLRYDERGCRTSVVKTVFIYMRDVCREGKREMPRRQEKEISVSVCHWRVAVLTKA